MDVNFPPEMTGGNPGQQRTSLIPQKNYTKEDFEDIQELGKALINAYHDMCAKKKKEITWDIFLGSIDYVIRLHRERIAKLMTMPLTVEAVKGLDIEEPYTAEINGTN